MSAGNSNSTHTITSFLPTLLGQLISNSTATHTNTLPCIFFIATELQQK